ncbi:MAG: hypothetical protein LC731_08175, partial [Acidobacteria bacterium]|nr:hypothetical protein [Acidobacteriota bacterium]
MLAPIYAQQESNMKPGAPVAGKTDVHQSGLILKDVPVEIDVKGRYVFYLHGLIIENEGIRPTSPRFDVYEYQEILETFKNKGFIVISEPRPKGTDPEQY